MADNPYPWLLSGAPKTPARFRRGQWVKFKPVASINGAHTLPDGFVVAVYHPSAREADLEVESKGVKTRLEQFSPERVILVAPNGNNVPFVDGEGEVHRALWFPPEACPQLQPVTDRKEIPAARLANAHKDWQPRP